KEAIVDWRTFRPFFVHKMLIASSLVVLSGLVMAYLQAGVTAVFTDWKMCSVVLLINVSLTLIMVMFAIYRTFKWKKRYTFTIMSYLQAGVTAVCTDCKIWSGVLLIKVSLTLIMGMFSIYQTLKWKKRHTFTTTRLIRIEWGVGLVVLILGIWLSQISYPIAVENYDETITSDHVEADVYIKELKTGDQKMTVHVADLNGEEPESVEAKVTMPQHDMGSEDLIAEEAEDDNYRVELPFSMSGNWRLEIT